MDFASADHPDFLTTCGIVGAEKRLCAKHLGLTQKHRKKGNADRKPIPTIRKSNLTILESRNEPSTNRQRSPIKASTKPQRSLVKATTGSFAGLQMYLLDLKFFANDDEVFQSRDWKERYSRASRLRLCCLVGQAILSPVAGTAPQRSGASSPLARFETRPSPPKGSGRRIFDN